MKKKIKLDALKIQGFITSLDEKELSTIRGGTTGDCSTQTHSCVSCPTCPTDGCNTKG